MVTVAITEQGMTPSRAAQTKDADILVDICTAPKIFSNVVHQLQSTGFELASGNSGSGFARCTFIGLNQTSQIDVLCPEDAPRESLSIPPYVESLAIPGGRRAIEVAELATIVFGDEQPEMVIRVPLIAGALVVKAAAAIDQRTQRQQKHIADVIELLCSIADPEALSDRLSEQDYELLRRIAKKFDEDSGSIWLDVSVADRNRAVATLDLILR